MAKVMNASTIMYLIYTIGLNAKLATETFLKINLTFMFLYLFLVIPSNSALENKTMYYIHKISRIICIPYRHDPSERQICHQSPS